MGNILNPGNDNSFINLVKARDTRVFVDKTDFLEKTNTLFNTDGKLLAVTRPRRFGKTVTAHMLSAYYSKGYAGQNIFDKLEIANRASFADLTAIPTRNRKLKVLMIWLIILSTQ